jgi:uncharacterized membrane protein YuzA (DUF378 family)
MSGKNIRFMKTIDVIAAAFLFIGGINLGLVGLFDFDLIARIFGSMSVLSKAVYILVGISAIYDAVSWNFIQKRWECCGFFGKSESVAT